MPDRTPFARLRGTLVPRLLALRTRPWQRKGITLAVLGLVATLGYAFRELLPAVLARVRAASGKVVAGNVDCENPQFVSIPVDLSVASTGVDLIPARAAEGVGTSLGLQYPGDPVEYLFCMLDLLSTRRQGPTVLVTT